MKTATRTLIAAAMFAAFANGALAAETNEGAEAAATGAGADQVRAVLVAQGYEVRKIDMEDGMFEAYVIKDGKRAEVIVDSAMNIVETRSAD